MEETLGDAWFNKAFGDDAQQVYDDVIVPLIEKKQTDHYIVVSEDTDRDTFEAIRACNFSTLRRICQENCIKIRYHTEVKGWFAENTKAFILSPITYRFRGYYSRKVECFSPGDNRDGESSFSFLKE